MLKRPVLANNSPSDGCMCTCMMSRFKFMLEVVIVSLVSQLKSFCSVVLYCFVSRANGQTVQLAPCDAYMPVKTPTTKTPVPEKPIPKTPVTEAPTAKTGTSKTPTSKTATSKTPTSKTATSETPTSNAPALTEYSPFRQALHDVVSTKSSSSVDKSYMITERESKRTKLESQQPFTHSEVKRLDQHRRNIDAIRTKKSEKTTPTSGEETLMPLTVNAHYVFI